jgi:flagellar basal-body rod protein FlgG
MGMLELGGVIIAQATQRAEFAAQNMANMTTAGYKARRQFISLIDSGGALAKANNLWAQTIDFAPGKLQQTGNPLDLAIAGAGFFTVRTTDGIFYTRAGQFRQDTSGNIVTADGAVLQSANGDIKLSDGPITVLADGTVQQDGQPVAQLQISDFEDPAALKQVGNSLFAAPTGAALDVAAPQIRQGVIETSNVSTASEMISLMTAIRSAETGQRVIQVYDDLLGRVLTAFGQM